MKKGDLVLAKEGNYKTWPAVVINSRSDEVMVRYVDPQGPHDNLESPWLPKKVVKPYTGQKPPCKKKGSARVNVAYKALATLAKRKKVSGNRLESN